MSEWLLIGSHTLLEFKDEREMEAERGNMKASSRTPHSSTRTNTIHTYSLHTHTHTHTAYCVSHWSRDSPSPAGFQPLVCVGYERH